jgi:hypothetical protein
VLAQLPAMEPVIDVVAVSEVDRLKPPRGQLLVHHSRVVGTWQLWVPCARPRTLGLYGGETTSNGCRSRSPERSPLGTGKVCAAMRRCASSKPRDVAVRGPRAPCVSTSGKAPSTSRDAGHAHHPVSARAGPATRRWRPDQALAAVRRPPAPCRDWACCAGRGAWPARSRRGSARRLPASPG